MLEDVELKNNGGDKEVGKQFSREEVKQHEVICGELELLKDDFIMCF